MPDTRRLLERAIRLAGGSQGALGRAIGSSQNAVYEATRRGRVSAEMAVAIHHATHGKIPVWNLRPDLWRRGHEPPPPKKSNGERYAERKKGPRDPHVDP